MDDGIDNFALGFSGISDLVSDMRELDSILNQATKHSESGGHETSQQKAPIFSPESSWNSNRPSPSKGHAEKSAASSISWGKLFLRFLI